MREVDKKRTSRKYFSHDLNKIGMSKDNQLTRLRTILRGRYKRRCTLDGYIVLNNLVGAIARRMGDNVRKWHGLRRRASDSRISFEDVMRGIERSVSREVYEQVVAHVDRLRAPVVIAESQLLLSE